MAGLTISIATAAVDAMVGSGVFGTFGHGSMIGGMMGSYYSGTGMMNGYSPWGMSGWGAYAWLWMPLLFASVALAAFGVFLMNSTSLSNLRLGSVLIIVGAILAFPTAFGFLVGSSLLIVAGILGLIWSPTRQTRL